MKRLVTCVDREGKNHQVDVNDLLWRPSVYGLYIHDDKILLSKQWDGYDFPGGGIEKHETITQALQREFFEETGLKVEKVGPMVACEESFYQATLSSEKAFHSILMYYLIEQASGELSTEYFDETEKTYADMAEWISLDAIEDITFFNSIDSIKVIQKALTLLT